MSALTFGLFADLHLDIMADGGERLETFLADCLERRVDFVISAGDFTYPRDTSRCNCPPERLPVNLKNAMLRPSPVPKEGILARYAAFPLPHYHTLGNHEMDFSTKEEAVRLLGMPGRYYDFTAKGWHFLVLDTNHYRDGAGELCGYCRGDYFGQPRGHWLDEEQLAWLAERLRACPEPAVLVSHQPLYPRAAGGGLQNYEALGRVLRDTGDRVRMCIYGHCHIDEYAWQDGVLHYCINSISNHWAGEGYACRRFDPATEEQFPNLQYTFPYQGPVYAIVTLDERGVRIRGRQSRFIPPSPAELGYTAAPASPGVESREFAWGAHGNGSPYSG